MDHPEHTDTPNLCCGSGEFGQPHDCEKQPGEEIPEPEEIQAIRRALKSVAECAASGDLESISVYGQMRDGDYRVWQTSCPNRHEDVGRMVEFLMLRLGFTQRDDVESMIDESET